VSFFIAFGLFFYFFTVGFPYRARIGEAFTYLHGRLGWGVGWVGDFFCNEVNSRLHIVPAALAARDLGTLMELIGGIVLIGAAATACTASTSA